MMAVLKGQLHWEDDLQAGHSEARLGGLRLRVYRAEGVWTTEIWAGRRLLQRFAGFEDLGEATAGAGLYAEGFLRGRAAK